MKEPITRSRFSIRSRRRSLGHALAGLRDMLITEPNAWLHATATVLVLVLCWCFHVDQKGFALIVVAIVMVWVAEAFNTVLEIMMDFVSSQQYSPIIKRAKDISAAAVLIASIGAVAIGVAVLGHSLWNSHSTFFRVYLK